MTFETVGNANYSAFVVRVPEPIAVPGLDRLKAVRVLGSTILTATPYKGGELALFFGAGSALSEPYAASNNLYRDVALNDDSEASPGYLDPNGRIKAVKFRKVQSDALLMPLESLEPLGVDAEHQALLREGDSFDTAGGVLVVKKYETVATRNARIRAVVNGILNPASKVSIPRHRDTHNYWRNSWMLDQMKPVHVTQKLHGTSIRVGVVETDRQLTWWERVKRALLFRVPLREQHTVIGSRNVIKRGDEGDIWTEVGHWVAEVLFPGETVYGEIIGWDGDSPIQAGYTYGIPKGQWEFVLYRVVSDGVELTASEVYETYRHIFNVVPLLEVQSAAFFDEHPFMDTRYADFCDGVWPTDPGQVDEGVVIRQDGPGGLVLLKAKSPEFVFRESAAADAGELDVEDAA